MTGRLKTRTCTQTHVRARRRGITLLEVLISMFVALVGLLGLASLFWLGGVEMSEGAKLDRALSVARSAQRSLKIYGLLRPLQTYTSTTTTGGVPTTTTGTMQTWVAPSSNSTTSAQFVDSVPATPVPTMPFSSAMNPFPYGYYTQGFAIDPLGVIANPLSNTDSSGHPFVSGFPAVDATGDGTAGSSPTAITYGTPSSTTATTSGPPSSMYGTGGVQANLPCLNRITLMAYPQALTGTNKTPTLWTAGTTPAPGTPLTFSPGQADLIFHSGDDLLLNPPNGDYPPTQFFSSSGRRQSQGDYSWLATVVPSFSTYLITTPAPTVFAPIGDTNLVRVSIVVFYKRNPVISIDPTYTTAPSERMVAVNAGLVGSTTAPIGPDGTTGTAAGLVPTGVAGGDVQLASPEQSYLNLKAGQWIMLSQAPPTPPTTLPYNAPATNPTQGVSYWYRWYKVVATGAIQYGTNGNSQHVYYRNVTLLGPDWNPQPYINATTPITIPTYASIIDGVVAVYEKEIELEQSGAPWAPN